ncbi:MAG: ATP-binding protein [Acidovorax sp.]|uniref:sensor histidine kinase n=1 Tax=Acidovorax sp. TaxID=1872122 RepID=UPI0026200199|nr:ATP-binding protein [Acidovorax sp.]MDH4463280.1 ATP-binding protein [Acidovorax sp.]
MSEDDLTPEQLRAALAASQQKVADMAAAQEEFLRAVSHDLRAPLRHVTSYGTLVREVLAGLPAEAGAAEEVQEALGFLATMDQSARRMGGMLDGLLAIARASRAPLLPRPVPLAHALQQAQTQIHAAPQSGAAGTAGAATAVTWRVDAELPALQADPALLHELLVQLLANAVKFSRGSAPPVVAIAPAAATEGQVAFTIEDNGVGFDPARAGQLFGVFQRLHRESEFEGVGAGLALCRTIALRHGGEVSATARPGAGCTVRVQWPAAVPGPVV